MPWVIIIGVLAALLFLMLLLSWVHWYRKS